MNFMNLFTEEQIRRQYAKNARQLREMQAIAEKRGAYNGYTAEQLAAEAAKFEMLSKTYTHERADRL